jgi:hypothetical protein
MSQPQGALANLYFLGHHPDDKAEWQGQFVAPVGADFYLAQLFDPATGAPAQMVVIPVDRIAAYRWALYSSAEEWRRDVEQRGRSQ